MGLDTDRSEPSSNEPWSAADRRADPGGSDRGGGDRGGGDRGGGDRGNGRSGWDCSDPWSRHRLVLEHRGLAVSLAERYVGRGIDREDLHQVAMVGLVKAVDRFDPDRGVAFTTFAVPTILGEVRRHFRDIGWCVQVPRRLKQLRRQATLERERLEQELHRSPSVREVADCLDAAPDEVEVVLHRLGTCWRPDEIDPDAGVGQDEVDGVCRRLDVARLLEVLGARERHILVLRYRDGLTQREIADRVGVSQMHVSRLIRASLARLRALVDPSPTPAARSASAPGDTTARPAGAAA